jgi:hypothetical protein
MIIHYDNLDAACWQTDRTELLAAERGIHGIGTCLGGAALHGDRNTGHFLERFLQPDWHMVATGQTEAQPTEVAGREPRMSDDLSQRTR